MPSPYTPSFVNPLTKNLKVTDTLTVNNLVGTTASIADLTVTNSLSIASLSLESINASTGTFAYVDASTGIFAELSATHVAADSADIAVVAAATGTFSAGIVAPQILTGIQYVSDGVRDIQDGIDAATSGKAIYLGPGSFGGSTVVIAGKDNIAIIAPPRGQGAICELSGGRAMTIQSSSSRVSVANLQVEGLLTLAPTGNNYFTNSQFLSGITVAAGASGNYFFNACEIAGPLTVPATFAGLITFAQCNFAGATFSLAQASTLQVQIALCLNLPDPRPARATYGSTNADTSLAITLDATVANVQTLNVQDINAATVDSHTGSFVSLQASSGSFDTLYADTIITPVVPGSDSYWNGWFQVTNKSALNAPSTGPIGPSGYDMTDNYLGGFVKYVHFDAVSQHPNIVGKFYPVLLDTVFEQAYTEWVYSSIDADTISFQYGPNTSSFDAAQTVDVLIQGGLNGFPPTFQKQVDNSVVATYSLDQFIYRNNDFFATLMPTAVAPNIIPYSNLAVKSPSFASPLALFNLMDELVFYNASVLNPAYGNNSLYEDVARRDSIKKAFLDGVTYEYPIERVQISTTSNAQPDTWEPVNGVTRFQLAEPHLVTMGSNITISDFQGSYHDVNGDYSNQITFSYNRKQPLADNNHTDRASMPYYCHGFDLILDTHLLAAETTGAYKGYGDFNGNPVVSVTHHVTNSMSYPEFVAALNAYLSEAYGAAEHAYITFRISTADGRPAAGWKDLAGTEVWNKYLQDFSTKLSESYSCDYLYNNNDDLATWFEPADPFDMLTTFQAVPNSAYGLTVSDNYLEEAFCLHWTFTGTVVPSGSDGADVAAAYQAHVADIFGLAQPSSNIAMTHAPKSSAPAAGWSRFGVSMLDDQDLALNWFNFGIVKSALTNVGQKVGYVNIKSMPALTEAGVLVWEGLFFPQGQTFSDAMAAPDTFANGQLAMPLGYIMRWFASQGVTDIIIDNSQNWGGYNVWLAQHLGENRKALDYKVSQPLTDNQEGDTSLITAATASQAPIAPADLQCTYLNATYGAGTVWNSGKVVVLYSETTTSAGVLFRNELLGDNRDGVIGACQVKHLGNCRGYFIGASMNPSMRAPNTAMNNVSVGAQAIGVAYDTSGMACSVDSAGDRYYLGHLDATSDMSDNSSILKGAGNAWGSHLEELIYPDFGFSANTRPLLPGDVRSQQPDTADVATWRYAYLEEAIKEIKLTW